MKSDWSLIGIALGGGLLGLLCVVNILWSGGFL